MPSTIPSSSSLEHGQQQSMIINDNNHSFANSTVNNYSQNQQRLSRSLNVSNNINNNNSEDPNNNMNQDGEGGVDVVERRDIFEDIRNGGGNWSHLLRQVVLTTPNANNDSRDSKEEDSSGVDASSPVEPSAIPLQICGGSENGLFVYLGLMNSDINSWIAVGYLQPGDIILKIETQQVSGYTQSDVLSLLHHCLRGNSVTLTVVPRGSLGPDLRSYLNTRFQKRSVDHALQGVVRDNLYWRTVPVTTRPPRPGEVHGEDYTFLSPEEFMELESNGNLLESGVYAGNHYGTPKPYASRPRATNSQTGNSYSAVENNKNAMLPGLHPSSEGKRRRNRSNVEALGAGDDEPPSPNINSSSLPVPVTYSTRLPSPDELGPLPSNWEMSYTEKGEVYFIDHNTGTSHWLDPRLSRIQKLSLEDCADNELPFGWEMIEDPHYGTYYIDHVNRRTQFENPVILAKQLKTNVGDNDSSNMDTGDFNPQPPNTNVISPPPKGNPPQAPPKPMNSSLHRLSIPRGKTPIEFNSNVNSSTSHSSLLNNEPGISGNGGLRVKSIGRDRLRFFTRDPTQLVGERIHCALLKSSRGLGFTIVGGDDDDGLDEFLQIKSVVTDGPAWRDGKLRTGDVLVRVNGRCVLGFTHQEMVGIFQSISPGEEVHLEVCRGYPLPFDPADPNTEIVTTVAVAPLSSTDSRDKRTIDWTGRATPDSLAHSAHSLPELSNDRIGYGKSITGNRPASVDLLLDSPSHMTSDQGYSKQHLSMESGVFLTIELMKGAGGFGFTIADSVAGQKVKKVLDPTHCGGLEEGDRLIAIDNIDLRGLSHTQVVQVLKDFPLGRKATLTTQRVRPQLSYTQKNNSIASNHYSDTRISAESHSPGLVPRSKTPTAEFGRTRPRLRDSLPERPKTPLLDSGGHINGQPIHFNGEIQHVQNSHSHLSERFSSSSLGGTSNNEPNFSGNDLSQVSLIRDWVEMTIELQRRQEGFGFRIVGGTEEGSQVSVGHIVPRGAAALDGRLQTNDHIIAVDGIQVIGASHHSAVQLMGRSAAAGRVRLTIRRPIYGPVAPPEQQEFVTNSSSSLGMASLHVTLRRQPSEGFGFVIISNIRGKGVAAKAGATIGRIVDGSPADRCGHIHVGDRILAVNHIDISQLHHSQVVQLIKDSGLVLTLSVLASSGLADPNQPQMSPSNQSTATITDLQEMTLKSNHGYDIGTSFISPDNQPVHFSSNHSTQSSLPESLDQVFSVQLGRGARGFGFSIRGGKEFQNMPLFVLRLAEDGPATQDGRIQVGDQILQINGISTQGMTHSQAIHIIKTGDTSVHMLLRRGAVLFPFLNQMPNFSTGFGSSNGQEEEQSLSSNNDPQFISQNSPMFRDHNHSAYSSHT